MASSYYKLDVKHRKELRSKGSKLIRKQSLVPGVLYYAGAKSVNISIDKSVLFHAIQSGQRIFEIDQDGESQYTMIKQLQYHPVTDEVIHIDLMRVRRSEKITISVPLVLVGDSVGVREGGLLSQSLNQVEISCFPTDVPEHIELNIEDLELNSAKSVADLDVGLKDVDIVTDPSLNIVSVAPPVAEEESLGDEDSGEPVDTDELSESEVSKGESGGDSKDHTENS